MTAGLKTLEILGRPGAYEHLEKVTGRLIEGILQAGRDAGHAVSGGHISGWHACMHVTDVDLFSHSVHHEFTSNCHEHAACSQLIVGQCWFFDLAASAAAQLLVKGSLLLSPGGC